MRIGINAALYSAREGYRQTGISRYISELIGGLVDAGIVRGGDAPVLGFGADGSLVGWPSLVFVVGLFLAVRSLPWLVESIAAACPPAEKPMTPTRSLRKAYVSARERMMRNARCVSCSTTSAAPEMVTGPRLVESVMITDAPSSTVSGTGVDHVIEPEARVA